MQSIILVVHLGDNDVQDAGTEASIKNKDTIFMRHNHLSGIFSGRTELDGCTSFTPARLRRYAPILDASSQIYRKVDATAARNTVCLRVNPYPLILARMGYR